MIEFVSRPAVAAALGLSRQSVKELRSLPAPDAQVRGTGQSPTLAWAPNTIERWAKEQGRPLTWPWDRED